MAKYIPERGDIVWLDFDPQTGHEQKGRRPALVLSKKIYSQKTGLVIFCPITSQIKGYPFEVLINGKVVSGVALSDQFISLDYESRDVKYVEKIKQEDIESVMLLARAMFN